MSDTVQITVLHDAARAAIKAAGGQAALAKALGISRGAVHQWQRVPADLVPKVSHLTGIPGRQLRPDMWEMPPAQPADAAR